MGRNRRRQGFIKCLVSLSLFFLAVVVSLSLCGQQVEAKDRQISLPPLQAHPLPSFLAAWHNPQEPSDYFSEIEETPAGYLVWTEFPLRVYVEKSEVSGDLSASQIRFQQWLESVLTALNEWNQCIPLTVVEKPELAHIVILRENPPLGVTVDPETGKLEIPRARSAQTRYEFYLDESSFPVLRHRMEVKISPNLSQDLVLSATRHEFGHALGIWGHSPLETDALYFSQVRNPPPISVRDINTLKKIYQQPTRLGWEIMRES